MNLSTARASDFLEEIENELSTGERLGLSDYEKELLQQCQVDEDRKHEKLERIDQAVSKICFNQFPWLQCESVEFCKQQRRDELVRVFVKDAQGKLPTAQTARAIQDELNAAGASPWQTRVEMS